jgi:hypothetical protein|tara:strand:+ start:237 stop:428 length:192 start_codon:yes stop_codon:yes gene_type:complete
MEFKDAKYIKDYMDAEKKTEPYITISCTVGGRILSIPTVVGNRYYDEAMKQVKEGKLTIKDAD